MSVASRLSKACEEKTIGNEFFKHKDLQRAIKKYHRALLQIKDLEKPSPLSDVTGSVHEQLPKNIIDEIISLRCTCYNNLAACLLQKQDYNKVASYTSMVLEHEPDNVKALFRRGQAYLKLGDVDEADGDFRKVKKLDPTDACVDKFIRQVEEERKKQRADEKVLFRKMFARSSENPSALEDGT